MDAVCHTGVILSDFNVANCDSYLESISDSPKVRMLRTQFGQVQQLLMDSSADVWQQRPEFTVVWTQPHVVIPSFQAALRHSGVSTEQLLQEVDEYASRLMSLSTRTHSVFIPLWVLDGTQRGLGLLDLKNECGLARLLMEMNLRLCSRLQDRPNFYPLNTSMWIQATGRRAFVPKLWYMAKVPFANEVFKLAALELKAALRTIFGEARKMIVVDLDNTLWGGVVGELGWEHLILGGHDADGEAFVDFQRELKTLTQRGILLAIASKNDESVALEAIDCHPEMVLRREDFVSWRINWKDKAENIAQLADELNLGLQSVVFLDDNPAERLRISAALPEVLVPDWPTDPCDYRSSLQALTCFDSTVVSSEDRQRTAMYHAERQRSRSRSQVATLDDWLRELSTRVTVERLHGSNLARATQLLNKTNQMNLSTRRMTETEFLAWSQQPGRRVWTFTVSDRFGSQGMTGVLSVEAADTELHIVDFLLSCRVLCRGIEELMLATATQYAHSSGFTSISALYRPTAKNSACLAFLQRCGFACGEKNGKFCWDAAEVYRYPEHLQIEEDRRLCHA